MRWAGVAALLAMTLGGCHDVRVQPPVRVLPSDAAFAWPSVLAEAVGADGRVDLRRVAAAHGALDLAVQAVAEADPAYLTGPAAGPGAVPRADRLAFLINASNTLWVLGAIREGIPDRLGPAGRVEVLRLAHFTVAGQEMTLDRLQREFAMPYAVGPDGDWRVPLALYCPAASCPGLARTPYTGPGLEGQMQAAAQRFLADPRNVQVDPAARTVRVSALLAPTPGLTATLNRVRGGSPIPRDYRMEALPFDWTLPAP